MGQEMGLSSSSLSLQGLAGGPSLVLQVTGAADSMFTSGQEGGGGAAVPMVISREVGDPGELAEAPLRVCPEGWLLPLGSDERRFPLRSHCFLSVMAPGEGRKLRSLSPISVCAMTL